MSGPRGFGGSPGATTIIVLAVLTLVEYVVSAADMPGSLILLLVIAVAKAYAIVMAFMHLRNILGGGTP